MTEEEEFEFRARLEAEQAAQKAAPTLRQKVISSTPARILQGARDPIDAGAQLLPRALEFVSSAGGFFQNPVSDFFGSEAQRVDAGISQFEREYQQARQATGQEGTDVARLFGNVVSPANLAVASRLPAAVSTGGRIAQGAFLGGIGGAMSPVNTEENPDFAATKLGQMATGAGAGAIATPVLGKLGDYVVTKLAKAQKPTPAVLQKITEEYAKDAGIDWGSLSQPQRSALLDQAVKATQAKYGDNAVAGMRAADFEALGMPYTLGQVTRDPAQFALEKNLSQTSPELTQRFSEQARLLRERMGNFAAGAQSQQGGGDALVAALRNVDESKRKAVSAAYTAARQTAGKDAEIPLGGLASDFGNILDRYSSNVLKSLPVKEFNRYGLMGGRQTKLFTVEEADKLLKTINANKSSDPAVNSALGELRDAVKRAVVQDAAAGVDDVFAPARAAAAQRFELQRAIPALAASADNTANPDMFVDNFIVSRTARTSQVKEMADLLRNDAPDAYAEARAQIGAYLQRKAFGENPAGDAKFSPDRYARALREIGEGKLSAFFSPQEVAQIQRIGRAGAFIESTPAGRVPNTSGNWAAITGIARQFPGAPAALTVGGAMTDALRRKVAEQSALGAKIPAKPTPEQIRYLSQLLSAGAIGSGSAQGAKINER